MVINLECPWCSESVSVTREQLDGEIECSVCDIRFAMAPDEGVALPVAA